ncbi:hypothetical protein RB623_06170 [Mesorhizobium sp. LHD-90]|uniref:hypothetical protein n=1 Tax=Mesorhizobium sp. LHD-90 TaxID=3071414 RepID=UPI0027E1F5DF|nr:hypothetical protein [Mesorhizobium sp. LHD-90]MDQ6433634.1 hypothetical protein [Mesorhizobium sp. LHD-90]
MLFPENIQFLVSLLKEVYEPDRGTDVLLHRTFVGDADLPQVPYYTASIDAAVELVHRALPGWTWQLMSGAVADDVWVMPDFQHPSYGPKFEQEWPEACKGHPALYFGSDIMRKPSGYPATALIYSFLVAKRSIQRIADERAAELSTSAQ